MSGGRSRYLPASIIVHANEVQRVIRCAFMWLVRAYARRSLQPLWIATLVLCWYLDGTLTRRGASRYATTEPYRAS